MLAGLDENLDRQLPERVDSDHELALTSEIEDARAFHYGWAHVILTTMVLDTLRSIQRFCNAPSAPRPERR